MMVQYFSSKCRLLSEVDKLHFSLFVLFSVAHITTSSTYTEEEIWRHLESFFIHSEQLGYI